MVVMLLITFNLVSTQPINQVGAVHKLSYFETVEKCSAKKKELDAEFVKRKVGSTTYVVCMPT